jgi:hypothetical protein
MTKQRQRERQRRRQAEAPKAVHGKIVFTESDVFVEFDGLRIAKRGHPDTEHAGTWISLEPGWVVYSSASRSSITAQECSEADPVKLTEKPRLARRGLRIIRRSNRCLVTIRSPNPSMSGARQPRLVRGFLVP